MCKETNISIHQCQNDNNNSTYILDSKQRMNELAQLFSDACLYYPCTFQRLGGHWLLSLVQLRHAPLIGPNAVTWLWLVHSANKLLQLHIYTLLEPIQGVPIKILQQCFIIISINPKDFETEIFLATLSSLILVLCSFNFSPMNLQFANLITTNVSTLPGETGNPEIVFLLKCCMFFCQQTHKTH